ncbi:MAG: sodium:proton antiporter [Bacteroidetes bacterium 4572_128]|nr:MAG: sodium:proton antiporter [Bacteroidetes bacterium 4572_128]
MSKNLNIIINALSKVIFPEKKKDIVSLEVIKNLSWQENKISFDIALKNLNYPFKNSIKKAAINSISKTLSDKNIPACEISINFISEKKRNVNFEKPKNQSLPNVKNIIAVASGKGGVGKSTVAVNLAMAAAKEGYKVALLDADIFGPSIPKMFGVEEQKPLGKKVNGKDMINPVEKSGIKILSLGFFVNPNDATIWRGAMATSALKQMLLSGNWGEIDYMFIDLPPGTSDVHLTLVQTVSVTGAVIVSTPQNIALADAIKGISMFKNEKINVPILGLIENMAWFTPAELPNNKYYIFGKDGCKNLSNKLEIPFLGQIPLIQSIRENSDEGIPTVMDETKIEGKIFSEISKKLNIEISKRNLFLKETKKVEIDENADGCKTN